LSENLSPHLPSLTSSERRELLQEEEIDQRSFYKSKNISPDIESSKAKATNLGRNRRRSKATSSGNVEESCRKPKLHFVQHLNECNSLNTNNSNSASSNEDIFAYSKASFHQDDLESKPQYLHHRQVRRSITRLAKSW